jgi:hypothetical protein
MCNTSQAELRIIEQRQIECQARCFLAFLAGADQPISLAASVYACLAERHTAPRSPPQPERGAFFESPDVVS